MSPTLRARAATAALERVPAALAAVALFAERPLRGVTGRADWRLCGQLSELVASSRVAGEPGEAVLLPTFGGLRAPLLLALGAGAREAFDANVCRAFARDAVERALGLRATDLALALPESEWSLRERALAALTGASLALPAGGPDVSLALVPCRAESARLASVLAELRPDALPAAVSLEPPAERPRGRSRGPSSGRPAPAPPHPR